MSIKKRGLSRGLAALLSDSQQVAAEASIGVTGTESGEALRSLSVTQIIPGKYQPRKVIAPEALRELADSIRAQGVIQPVVVRAVSAQQFELIAGERRWRAAQLAGLTEIPAIIKQVSDSSAIAMALIENIQREDLNPVEEAVALQRLLDEFEMTHQQVADAVGKSRSAITNALRLLNLQEEVKQWLGSGSLEMGHARALLGLGVQQQVLAARRIIEKGLSVREAERLARQLLTRPMAAPATPERTVDPNISQIQQSLSDKLAAKVLLQHQRKGSGKLVIHYNNLDELEGILEKIR